MEKDIEECNFPNNISFFFQYDENKIIKHAGKDNIIFVHIYIYARSCMMNFLQENAW